MDLMDGKCVRLRQGDFAQRTDYSDDPIEVARSFQASGFRRLHVVDLDGARSGTPKHLHVLEALAKNTSFEIDFSGGIKTNQDIAAVFEKGAALAAIGSVAVKNKPLFFNWLEKYGAEKILLGVDVREEKLAVGGWSEQTSVNVFDFLQEMTEAGVSQVFCTDISKDGLLEGAAVQLYQKILKRFPALKLIASGGVRSMDDVRKLEAIGCAGVIVGKALYQGNFSLPQS